LLGRRVPATLAVARYYGDVPAFVDGWGLYAVDLARARGGFATPIEEYGALALEMVAAARLVVDTGIHYFGWTYNQAVEFLTGATLLAPVEIEADIARIAEDAPGESLAAEMGVHELRGMHTWMAHELGDRFDDKAFRRELESLGPVPLRVAGTHFEWWLWQQKRQDVGSEK
jgi:uncharacterized protein (DUF885 family)